MYIIHLQIKEGPKAGHYYFGGMSAMYDQDNSGYSREELGVAINTLYKNKLPYENSKVVVRTGFLTRKKRVKNVKRS